MLTVELKWRANMEKVAFAKAFPALLASAGDAGGRAVVEVLAVDEAAGLTATIFDGGMVHLAAGGGDPAPADILKVLWVLRERLEPFHREAYAKLDELAAADRELTRQARKENILGAIRNNIGMIPELYEEIPRLLDDLRAGNAGACGNDGGDEL